MVNYYDILGIPVHATGEDIKKAFRAKAKLFHPDVNNSPEAGRLFQLMNEAYEILSNESRRYLYDLKLKYNIETKTRIFGTNHPSKKYGTHRKRDPHFHYKWGSFAANHRREHYDMRKRNPFVYYSVFVLGLFFGFLLSMITIGFVSYRLWNPAFLLFLIPGVIIINGAWNGLSGKENNLADYFGKVKKLFSGKRKG